MLALAIFLHGNVSGERGCLHPKEGRKQSITAVEIFFKKKAVNIQVHCCQLKNVGEGKKEFVKTQELSSSTSSASTWDPMQLQPTLIAI
jgi:hypothetical protein